MTYLIRDDHQTKGKLVHAFSHVLTKYTNLAREKKCGWVEKDVPSMVSNTDSDWVNRWKRSVGTITNCGTMCQFIGNEINDPTDFNQTMNQFALYIKDNFRSWSDMVDVAPEDRTDCQEQISSMFRAIALF